MILLRRTINPLVLLMVLVGFAFSDVTVSLDDVEVDGYTADIIVPVSLSNPSDGVGGFQFDVIALPALVQLSDDNQKKFDDPFERMERCPEDGEGDKLESNGCVTAVPYPLPGHNCVSEGALRMRNKNNKLNKK